MKNFLKFLAWTWNIIQGLFAFSIVGFFAFPSATENGHEVIWISGSAITIDSEVFAIGKLHFALWVVVGLFAILYVIAGFVEAAYVPSNDKWLRGFNWAFSLIVAFPLAWVWYLFFWGADYQITTFQQGVLIIMTGAVALDIAMDTLLPWIKKAGDSIPARPTPP